MRHKVHWRHSRQPYMKAWNTDTTGGTAIHLLTAFGSNASVAHCQCWEALTWLPLLPRTTSCAQTLRQVSSYDPSRPKFHAGNPKGRICSNEQLFETLTVVWQPCGNSSATALAGCKFVLYHGGGLASPVAGPRYWQVIVNRSQFYLHASVKRTWREQTAIDECSRLQLVIGTFYRF